MNLFDAQRMATELMRHTGLSAKGWSFAFDNAKRRAGVCKFSTKTISLSRPHVEMRTPDQVREIILHEIAHAEAGAHAGHGPQWQHTARALGLKNPTRSVEAVGTIPAMWTIICPTCGPILTRHRRSNVSMICVACNSRVTYVRTNTLTPA